MNQQAAYDQRRAFERATRPELSALQLQRLNLLLAEILPKNSFYAEKLAHLRPPLTSLDSLGEFPYTYKDELVEHPAGEWASNLTYPPERYVRFHRTSGTHGRPMVVVDTQRDWQWWLDTWQYVLDAAHIEPADRVLMAFSFGPFVGFWSAHDAIAQRGAMVIPAGGLDSVARLELIQSSRATVICCTPSYAMHLTEVASQHQIDLRATTVTRIIVAGEPGGSVSTVRQRIEAAWKARVIDHSGATEVGPWGYPDPAGQGLHIVESEFLPEFLSISTGEAAAEGEIAELVLTSLGRYGCPVLRYRTGDLVRPSWRRVGDNGFVFLPGGVLGRVDDMLVIRGVNIYPSSVEQILHGFPEIVEYRIVAKKHGAMDGIHVEIEDRLENPARVAEELKLRLGLNVEVSLVAIGSLPRFEAKGKRFIDQRHTPQH